MPGEQRCDHCGQPVRPGTTKCPDCGAPVWPEPVRAKDRRPSMAGLILLSLLALNLFQSLYVVADPAGAAQQPIVLGGPSFHVTGRIQSANGTPLGGVQILEQGHANVTNTSAADGSFRLDNVSMGFAGVEFQGPGNASVLVRLFMVRDQALNVTLPAGATSQTIDHGSYRTLLVLMRVCGGLLLGLGLLTLAGAIACYRRRNWGLAMAGAVAGLFALLPLSLLLGGIAIAIVATSRSQFRA